MMRPTAAALALALFSSPTGAQAPDAELAEGVRQIQLGDFDAAAVTLDRVVRRLTVAAGAGRDLVEARLQLAVAYVFLERMEEARAQFKEALIADPSLRLSNKDYPARVVNAFESALREVAPRAAPAPAPPTLDPTRPASPAPAPRTPPGTARSGGSRKPLLIGGAAVLVGAGAAVALLGGTDPLEVDDDGDGFAERAGDCNDADPTVRPGGGFTFSMDFSFRGSIPCSTRNSQQVYRVRNNSCAAMTVQRLTVQQMSSAPCPSGFTRDLVVTSSSVASGATTIIRTGTDAGRSTAFCCSNPPCAAGPCPVSEVYTVVTDQGQQALTNNFTSINATGLDCPLCSAVVSHHLLPEMESGACLLSTAPWD